MMWNFLIYRKIIQDSVPKDVANSTAIKASLAATGNPAAPILWVTDKASDEQEKESLRREAESRLSVDQIINKLKQSTFIISDGQQDETALKTHLKEIFEPSQLEQLRAAAERMPGG